MFRNYISLLFSQVGGRAISFFWVIFLARRIGVENYGIYGSILAVTSMGASFIDFGVQYIVIRDGVNKPFDLPKLIGGLFYIRFIFALLVTLAILIFAYAQYSPEVFILFFLACLHMIFHNLGLVGDVVYSAKKQQRLIAIMSVLHSSGWALLGLCALLKYGELKSLFWAMSINSAIYFLINAVVLYKFFFRPDFSIQFNVIKSLFLLGFPIGITGIFSFLSQRLDRVLIILYRGPHDAGVYNAISSLIAPITDFVWCTAIVILYPYMSQMYKDTQKFDLVFKNIVSWIFVAMACFVIPSFFFSDEIIRFLFGSEYSEAGQALPYLALSLLPIPIHGFLGRLLMIQNKQKIYAYVNLVVALIVILSNTLLIPFWGIYVPCINAIFANVLLIFLYAYYGRQTISKFIQYRQWTVMVFIGILIGMVLRFIPGLHVLISLGVFLIIFLPLAYWVTDFRNQWVETMRLVK